MSREPINKFAAFGSRTTFKFCHNSKDLWRDGFDSRTAAMTATGLAVDVDPLANRRANHAIYSLMKVSNERNYRTLGMMGTQVVRGFSLHILNRLQESDLFFWLQHGGARTNVI